LNGNRKTNPYLENQIKIVKISKKKKKKKKKKNGRAAGGERVWGTV
jgi:hypothetical protein